MEVTQSACLVASGYTLSLSRVSPLGACVAQQVPDFAMEHKSRH